MSEKPVKTTEKKSFSKILKWGTILLGVAILEIAGVVGAVKIIESRDSEKNNKLYAMADRIEAQDLKISNLEKMPLSIADNASKIAGNTGEINLLSAELNALKEEVGNKKMDLMNVQLSQLSHKMETLEESKNQEALVLSLALMIKENALYHRDFAKEADILAELAQGQQSVKNSVNDIIALKNVLIPSDSQIIEEYKAAMNDFIFSIPQDQEEQISEDKNRGAVARSIEMIKDTVAGINFDKVVVMKKEKKSNEQQLLLNTLDELMNTNNFNDAIAFVEQNSNSFPLDLNPKFAKWFEKIKQKVMFDKAISYIIAAELSAIRKDISNTTVNKMNLEE